MNQLTVTKRVCDHLGKYIFDRVWNEPYTEYRTNTRPRLLNTTPVSGMFNGRYEQLDLPSTNSYYVYVIEFNQFRPIKLNATSWISLLDYCNENCTDLQVYTDDGAVLWRKGIFIRQDTYGSQILIAVDSVMFHTIANAAYDPKKIFFTKYIDSDSVADNTIKAFQITASQIAAIKQNDPIPNGTIRLYNGKMLSGSYTDFLQAKGYAEVINDDDVISDILIDVSASDAPIYTASNSKSRILIHVPKADNPDFYLITHDSCDFYMIPKTMTDDSNVEINGVFVHQCNRRDNFHQVTFNDMSVDKDMLDEIAEANGIATYYLRVLVRTHKKKLGVARDAAYCDLLYTHDDDVIVKFLLTGKRSKGTKTFTLDFWKASELDKGSYAHVLANRIYNTPSWNTRVPTQCTNCGLRDVCTSEYIEELIGADIKDKADANLSCPMQTVVSVSKYIDVLGYFNTLSIICRRVSNFKVTADGVHTFPVHVPLALSNYQSSYFKPIVYLNGMKVPSDKVTNGGDGTTYIYGLEEIYFSDKIRVRGGTTWDADNRRIQVTVDSSVEIKSDDRVTIELLPDIPEDSYDFKDLLQTFDVVETDFDPVATRNVSAVDFQMHKNKSSEYQFLNGRLLCEGIDYKPRRLDTSTSSDNHETDGTTFSFHPHVQNVSYLKLQNNISESIMTSDVVVGYCKGFLIGNRIEWNGATPFWFDNLSVLSIGGKVCSKFEYDGSGIQVYDGEHVNGEPYMIRTLVPKQVLDILGDYKKQDDLTRMTTLREYFYEFTEHPFYRTIIPKPHKVYSLYILKILKDYFSGSKTFECIDDPTAFEAQFSEYASYKNLDVIYQLNETELSYIDIYPIYHNIQVSNRETRHKVNFLVKMLTSSDVYKHREAVNV